MSLICQFAFSLPELNAFLATKRSGAENDRVDAKFLRSFLYMHFNCNSYFAAIDVAWAIAILSREFKININPSRITVIKLQLRA